MALKDVEIEFRLDGTRKGALTIPSSEDTTANRASRVKIARAFVEQVVNCLYLNDTFELQPKPEAMGG